MATAQILINGNPAAVTSLDIGDVVVLTNSNNTGVTVWQWSFLDKPSGSTATLSTPTTNTSGFTVDKEGSYLIQLVVNSGESTDTSVAAALSSLSSIRWPAANETTEVNTSRGWAESLNDNLIQFEREIRAGGILTAQAAAALAIGVPLRITGAATLPDGSIIPIVDTADATATTDLPAIGIAGSAAAAPGDIVKVRVSGVFSEGFFDTSLGAVNDPVYVDDGGAVSLTPGTVTFIIGYIASVGVSGRIMVTPNLNNSTGSGGITGTGTANRVAYWDSGSSIAASNNFFFDSNNVGIGNSNPQSQFHLRTNPHLSGFGSGFYSGTHITSGNIGGSLAHIHVVTENGGSDHPQIWLSNEFGTRGYLKAKGNLGPDDFYMGAIGTMGFYTGASIGAATRKMRLSQNGNFAIDEADNTFFLDAVNNRLGLGTATPSRILDVVGPILLTASTPHLFDSTDNSGVGNTLTLQNNAGGAGLPVVNFIRGSVEIGQVLGYDGTFSGLIDGLNVSAVGGKSIGFRVGGTNYGTLSSSSFILNSGSSTLGVDFNNNRLGIGTTSPGKTLDIVNSVNADIIQKVRNSSNGGYSAMAFYDDSNSERMSLGYGNSGTGAPYGSHTFIKSVNSDFVFLNSASAIQLAFTHSTGNWAFDTDTLYVDASNNRVGIKTASPGTDFHVNGTARIGNHDFYQQGGGATVLALQASSGVGSGLRIYPPTGDVNTSLELFQTSDTSLTNFNRLMINSNYPTANAINFVSDFKGTGTLRDMVWSTGDSGSGIYTERLRLTTSGNLKLNNQDFTPVTTASGNVGTDALQWGRVRGASMVITPGTSSGSATVSGVVDTQTTPVGNVGAGEDTLMTYTLPANSLVSTGRGVRYKAIGAIANNINAKTLKFYFGSQMISVTVPISIAADWIADALIIRTGASAQRYSIDVKVVNSATNAMLGFVSQGTLTETESGTIVIKATGEATSNNDITQNISLIEYI